MRNRLRQIMRQTLLKHSLTPVAVSLEHASALSAAAAASDSSLPVHVKIDTDMGRLGLNTPDAAAELSASGFCPITFLNTAANGWLACE